MVFYHGTSERRLDRILEEGLWGRKYTRDKGNWDGSHASNPEYVYLSKAFAAFYAGNASKEEKGDRPVLLRMDIDLNRYEVFPDEDFLNFLLRDNSSKKSPDVRAHQDLCLHSLEHLGSIAISPHIAAPWIDHVIVDTQIHGVELMLAMGYDISISPIAYTIMGKMYERRLELMFMEGPEAVLTDQGDFLESIRQNPEIVKNERW